MRRAACDLACPNLWICFRFIRFGSCSYPFGAEGYVCFRYHESAPHSPCSRPGNNFYFYAMNLYGYQDGRGNLIVVRAKTKTNAQGRLLDKGYAALYSQIFMINNRDKEENKEKSPMSLT